MLTVPFTRVCYPAGGAEVTVKHDGSVKIDGIVVDIHEKFVNLLHVPNETHVTSASTLDECYERMMSNETDVILTRGPPTDDDNSIYYVAIQTDTFVNQIVSGYDYSEYMKQVEQVTESATALIKNFFVFDNWCIGLIIILLLLLLTLARLIKRFKLHRLYSRPLATTWRKRSITLYEPAVSFKLIKLILFSGFLLLGSPFLAKFQTNQVVTSPPDVITSYEQVIDRGAKIIFNREISDEFLLRPSAESIEKNDITARLYRYMQRNLMPFRIPSGPETASKFDSTVDALITGKAVMFAANYISDGFKGVFCSWSSQNHLIQSLISTDPSSREMFTGYPMRRGFNNPSLVKKLRREFEAHLQTAMNEVSPQFVGLDFKRDFTTPAHRQRQLVLCMTDDLVREQKEPQPTGLRSFSLFFACYIMVNLLILLGHLVFICCTRVRYRRKKKGGSKILTTQGPRVIRYERCFFLSHPDFMDWSSCAW